MSRPGSRNSRPRTRRGASVGSTQERLDRLSVHEEERVENNVQATADDVNFNQQQLQAVKSLLAEQQNQIASLLAEQKQELLDKVEDRKSRHRFRQKRLEEQFGVNRDFLNIVKRASACLEKNYLEKLKNLLEELEIGLEEHEEDLICADLSRNGWLTVKRIRNKSSVSSDLLKKLEKEDDSIDRRKKRIGDGRFGIRDPEMDKPPYKSNFRNDWNANKSRTDWTPKVVTSRTNGPKKSPEELLNETVKQTRAGRCGFCQREGHFFRECGRFWDKVDDQRKANLQN